ncbi:MAG: hypothetical protein M1827_007525 [Pycnora praestabilis]|nr:MAG: hypothetical protein M1827_007525 [Pycnora praestabilis]
MDPATLVVAEQAVSTTVEGGAAVALGVARNTMPIKAIFHKIPTAAPLHRSSHSISVVKGRAYIFGGEVEPHKAADNAMHVYMLPSSGVSEADYQSIPPQAATEGGEVPVPRVGHTANVVGDMIYVFGGRGGEDKAPLEEKGRVWIFDTKTGTWSYIDPKENTSYPEARYYHACVSNAHPIPTDANARSAPQPPSFSIEKLQQQLGSRSQPAEPYTSPHGTLFIHAGCTSPTARLSDTWSFDIPSQTWSPYPTAPSPARSGASLAFTQNRLYLFGGFSGDKEIGGQIDYLDILVSTFDDQGGKGEMALSPRTGTWETLEFPDNPLAPGPRPRSMAGFAPVTTGQGREYLLLFFGERDPAGEIRGTGDSDEHQSVYWSDVWSFQLRPQGMTAASWKDATRQAAGYRTGQGEWAEVHTTMVTGGKEDEQADMKGAKGGMGGRGWFAYTEAKEVDGGSVVLWGGLTGDNQTQGDGWIISVEG